APPAPSGKVAVKGRGNIKTKPFNLPAGDYTVDMDGSANGNVIADLYLRGGDGLPDGLFNEIKHGKDHLETQDYRLDAGAASPDVINDGSWPATFTPLG